MAEGGESKEGQKTLSSVPCEIQDIEERLQGKVYTPVPVKATSKTEFDVRSDSDEQTSDITGSAVVSKNRLILADLKNWSVKLVDTDTRQIKKLTVSSQPLDVTIISRNQVAVSLCRKPTILLLRVSDTLTLEREIPVRGESEGVTYTKNRLIVAYLRPPKLEIMDLDGNVMKRFEKGSDGKELFICPVYVCVSKDDETIYVSDSHKNTVTSLTFDGVVKDVYDDNELEMPQKVCVDQHDNIYVCGYVSKNVHMLTADLNKIRIILTQADGLDSPVLSVSHCQETNRLYVGMENNNKLKVYQLA